MSKKIKPRNQTKELCRAKWEFLKRNPEAMKESEIETRFCDDYEKRRKEEIEKLQSYPEMRASYDKVGQKPMPEYDEMIKNTLQEPAARDFTFLGSWIKVLKKMKKHPLLYDFNEKNAMYRSQILKDAKQILNELVFQMPSRSLIVVVDLDRTKEVIMEEVDKIVTERRKTYQEEKRKWVLDENGKFVGREPLEKEERLKWLPLVDELIEIWDLRNDGKSFKEISNTLGVTQESAKKRFYTVFQFIIGQQYHKSTWKELFKAHLEKLAVENSPTDKKFWDKVSKSETVSQADLIPKDVKNKEGNWSGLFDFVGVDECYELKIMLLDMKKICSECPDLSCQSKNIKRLSEIEAGDMGAFDDFHPECPKLYNYLKN